MVKNNYYVLHIEMVLNIIMAGGYLKKLDARTVSSSFYYCLKGLMYDIMLRDI